MSESIYTLPNDFYAGELSDVNIYFYQTAKSSRHTKINFKQNVLSILVEGHKEVFGSNYSIAVDNDRFLLFQSGNVLMTEKITERNNYKSVLFFFSDRFILNFAEKIKIKSFYNQHHNSEVVSILKDAYVLNF